MRKFGSTADLSSQTGRLIPRRDLLALTGAAGCALGGSLLALPAFAKPAAPRVSAPPYDELTYDIRFSGVPIGEQRLRFDLLALEGELEAAAAGAWWASVREDDE